MKSGKDREDSFIASLEVKQAELLSLLEEARERSQSIKETALKQSEEILRQARADVERILGASDDSDPSQMDAYRAQRISEAHSEAKRLAKRAERRLREASQFIFSRALLKERR